MLMHVIILHVKTIRWEVLDHPSTLQMGTSDFYLFHVIEEFMFGNTFKVMM